MEQLLKPVENPDSVFIYRDNQKFTCNDYDKLAELLTESLFETNQNERFMTDLRYSSSHPLMFEFSVVNKTGKNTSDFWNRFVDFMFLRALRRYLILPEITIVMAMSKSQTKGLRIYIVGVEISHDDYLHLCSLLKRDCHYREAGLEAVFEVRSNFPLPSSSDTDDLYVPTRLMNVHLEFYKENDIWHLYRQEFIDIDNKYHKYLVCDMMPISCRKDSIQVHFATDIYHQSYFNNMQLSHDEDVGSFESHLNHERYLIVRDSHFLERGKGFCYNFFKKHANNIILKGEGHILHFWHKLFYQRTPLKDPFIHLDQILKRQCPHLSNEPSPLKAVLLKYERPVYYALVNILQNEVNIDEIRKQFPFISKDLPTETPKEAKDLHFNTILYCAYMTGEGTIFDHLGVTFDYIAKNINSLQQLKNTVIWIQEMFFPIISNPKSRYIWNPIDNEWNETANHWTVPEIEDVVREIIRIINSYYELPTELVDRLFNNSLEWETLVQKIMFGSHAAEGNTIEIEKAEMYGHNVPEYYFLSKKLATMAKEDKTTLEENDDKLTFPSPTTEENNDKTTLEENDDKLTFPSPTIEEKDSGKTISELPATEEKDSGKEKITIPSPTIEEKDSGKTISESPATEEKDSGKEEITIPSPIIEEKDSGKDKSISESIIKENTDKHKLNVPNIELSTKDNDKSIFRVTGKESSQTHFSHSVTGKQPSLTHSSHHRGKEPSLTHSSHHRGKEPSLTHSSHHRGPSRHYHKR